MSEPANGNGQPGTGVSFTCGGCRFGNGTSLDLKAPLDCRRFPPQRTSLVVPGPQGVQIIDRSGYPQVARNTPSCGEYRSKLQS